MPADSPIEQSLALKKRARRRLVGAIALVILMLIILPIVLQDRVAVNNADSVKITMNETAENLPNAEPFELTPVPDDLINNAGTADTAESKPTPSPLETKPKETKPEPDTKPAQAIVENDAINLKIAELEKKTEVKKADNQSASLVEAAAKSAPSAKPIVATKQIVAPESIVLPKPVAAKEAIAKTPEKGAPKPAEPVTSEKPVNPTGFILQVGVYSDAANVAQLQAKLKQAGFTSSTETISTANGDKIRLRAGSYPTREAANAALTKLQAAGMSGLVMSKGK